MFSPPSFFSVTTPPETPPDAFPRRSHPHPTFKLGSTTATTSESASATSVSLQIPLTPSATEPITPTTGKPLFPDFHNSLKELLEPDSSMSPTEPRGLLHHPAPFNLGGELHTGGVSQERSTASNGNTQSSTLPPLDSWPKEDLFDLPLLSRPHSNMLPPLRTHEPTSANPTGTGIQYLYSTNPHTVHTYANNHYHSPYPPVYKHNHGYSNPATHSYPVYYIAHPQPSYASSPDPTAHMSNGQVYPPHQAPTPAYPYGTIPPATFQSWQGNNDERGRGSTISGSLLSGAAAHHEERLMDRRASSQSVGDRVDDHGDDHDHDHDQDEEHEEVGKNAKAPVSPASSAGSGSGKSDDDVIYAQEMPPSPPVQDGEMFYTTDAEVKQTRELKRMCYNCQAKKPPSWRKSLLHLGKILCNKCGIFERTHNRSRPRQNDDLKLRRPPAPYNRGNRAPPPAQLDLRADTMSSIGSPYSTVASMTPLSAGFGFPYGSPSTGHTGAVSAPPPLSEDQDSHRSVHFQHGHSSSSLSTSTVQDRRRQSDMDGYPTSSLGHNVMTSQDQYHPGHPNQFTGLGRAVSATSTRERGSDSPYAQAYNARRTASYSTSSRAKAKGGVLSAPMSAGLQPALSLWNHSQRRHSEANIHQVLDDSPE